MFKLEPRNAPFLGLAVILASKLLHRIFGLAVILASKLFHRIFTHDRYRIEPPEEEDLIALSAAAARAVVSEFQFQYLQEDILLEFLSRLPVKTLYQLKSVCKRWNQIITPSNPLLVSMHLRNYYYNKNTSPPPLIYELLFDDMRAQATVLQLDPDGDASQVWYLERPTLFDESVSPCGSQKRLNWIISGPCNGIFLLGDPFDKRFGFLLWNPTTGSLRELPVPEMHYDFFAQSYGFGLDTVANDIKVVLVLHSWVPGPKYTSANGGKYRCSSPECPSRVLVYSLRTDTWKELDEFRQDLEIVEFIDCYRYLNGFYFWLCASPAAVLAFDMGKDVFRVINDPVKVSDQLVDCFQTMFWKQLVIYKEDSLALFINQGGREWETVYDMWLLQTEEENWGWVKSYSFGPYIPPELHRFAVVGSWGDDGKQLVLLLGCGPCAIVLFDPATEATKIILSYSETWPIGIFAFKDSLVSVGETSVPVTRSIRPWVFAPIPIYDCEKRVGYDYMEWDVIRDFRFELC